MKDDSCLFCKIVDGKVPATPVFRSPSVVAFKDIHPQAPVHVLLVPTDHIAGVHAVNSQNQRAVSDLVMTANQVAADLGIFESGYRLVFNAKADGGQTVDHLHLHLLGGRRMTWPPG